jgi:hypothetical protein
MCCGDGEVGDEERRWCLGVFRALPRRDRGCAHARVEQEQVGVVLQDELQEASGTCSVHGNDGLSWEEDLGDRKEHGSALMRARTGCGAA